MPMPRAAQYRRLFAGEEVGRQPAKALAHSATLPSAASRVCFGKIGKRRMPFLLELCRLDLAQRGGLIGGLDTAKSLLSSIHVSGDSHAGAPKPE